MDTLWQDLRYGARQLARNPGFTAVAVLTLALGIGANTAIFSVVNAVMIRPLPFPHSDRTVRVYDKQPTLDTAPASYAEFKDWKQESRSLESMVAFSHATFNLTGSGEPERLSGAWVTPGYFSFFGTKPFLGRTFLPEEEQQGATPVVVLSYGLWQKRFGGNQNLVGHGVTLNDKVYTVVGVLPANVPELSWSPKTSLWVPVETSLPNNWRNRGTHFLTVVGRLQPGVTLSSARTEMEVVARRLDKEYATGHGIRLVPFQESLFGSARANLFLLLAAVGFLLLLATANVANLQLARTTGRRREMAVRLALGAGRLRLARQLLTESVLLGLLGGAGGILLALWGTATLKAAWPAAVAGLAQIPVDWRVGVVVAGISVGTGLLLGLAPAIQTSGQPLNETLKEGTQQASAPMGHRRLRHLLVVSEVALALLLVAAAGLMSRSLWRLQQVNPGFSARQLLTARVSLPTKKYREDWQQSQFFETLLAKLRTIPGVDSAATVVNLPLSGDSMNGGFTLEGRPPFLADAEPLTEKHIVSPGYFATLGIPLLRGRTFSPQDDAEAPGVAVINQAMAERFWPHGDSIGKRIRVFGSDWEEIIGVVGNVKLERLDQPPALETYVTERQHPAWSMAVVLRTQDDPITVVPQLQAQVSALDPDLPVYAVRRMADVISATMGQRRLITLVLSLFAAVAMLLAALGVYGVLSYSVSQRVHEIGVRMALGARPSDVLKLVVRQGLILTLAGLGIGLLCAFALTRFLANLLFGVSATDPLTLVAVTGMLVVVSLAACWIPARRATRIDPMVALRYE